MTAASILIVEDEKIIARGIEKRLKGMGYTVAGFASTGPQAVQNAAECRPDLILMDVRLGDGMDGVEAAALIRRQIEVPVVFLTAHSDDATLERAKRTEPFGYVLKPYEDKDLQIAIEIGLYKHQMERRLRENEQWLAATLGSIGDGVIAADALGRVRFLNDVAEQLTGWTQADAHGKDVQEVFPIVEEKSRQPVSNPVLAALEKGESAPLPQNTILLDRAGREWPIEDSAAPIRDVTGKVSGAVLVFRDVTERRRLEEHLRQAQKMEAVGRLAGGIAHDFNNIMTVVLGCCDLLLAQGRSDPEQELVRQISTAGQRAAALTQQILAFSRKQMLVPCVLNLSTIVRDMAGMIQRLIGEQIEFVTQTAPDLGAVKADPTQMSQVILNLALNARDAMPGGGRLVLRTTNQELDEGAVRAHPDVQPGRYALLSVGDTGCGMSADVLRHVFEPFFTTKEVGKGTGLGLAAVHGIVKQSGGHIEVSSEVGAGTTVRIYLPLVEDSPTEPAGVEGRGAFRGEETVLLVEDEEPVRRVITTVLEQNGYTVLQAANSQDALAVSDHHGGPIHLLLTDVVMPQMGGSELSSKLALLRPDTKVLFMSGFTEDEVGRLGVNAGGPDFLQKPFTLEALAKKVREILDRPAAVR